MPLQRLEHYLVLSDDIHKTRDFYRDVLGMAEGFRPELDFPGFWLYLGDVPCIHIAEWQQLRGVDEEGRHSDLDARAVHGPRRPHRVQRHRLRGGARHGSCARGLTFSENALDDIGLKQMFLRDPNGVPIEINFRS